MQVRGPGWIAVASTTAVVVVALGFSVSTQGGGRGRIVRVNGAEAIEGEVLLKYRDGGLRTNQMTIEAAADADQVETLDRRGMRRLRSRRLRTTELVNMLSSDPDVEFVEPNYVVRALIDPNDPQFPGQWGLNNTGDNTVGGGGLGGFDSRVREAWTTATGTRSTVIAILDTGVDYTHRDLAANMWSAPASFNVTIGGVTITCAAGTHGFNAVARTCDPMDDHFHGTHAAGVIGAVGNNGTGIAGVNWAASMMAVKILGSSGAGTVADAVAGLEFVLQAKAAFASTVRANVRVLSNSWASSGYSAALLNAIKAANDDDMLFVAAAGNSGSNNDVTPVYPASYGTANVVAVAAHTSTGERASFSNYGATSVDLAAPGQSILSTVPGDAYGVASGTSMAAPHVSGAALLALSMCVVSTPQLRFLLLHSVDPMDYFLEPLSTNGKLDAERMVDTCPYPKVQSVTLTSNLASPQFVGPTVRWHATAAGGRAPYQYKWSIWDGAVWTTASDWSADTEYFDWTPSTANDDYKVLVQVRSAWNTGTSEIAASKAFPVKSPVSSGTLTSDIASPQAPGTTITWTATASGGEAPYQYRFYVWDGAGWLPVRGWDTSNTFAWTPTVAYGDSRVQVQIRSGWSTGNTEFNVVKPFTIRRSITSLPLNASAAAPRLFPATVGFWTLADGGQDPYTYRFSVWDGVSWTILRNWDASTSFSWTPSVPNPDYKVMVQARSAWNTGTPDKSTVMSYPVMAPVASVNLTPDLASPRGAGTTVTFTATPSGGQAPYQYQWSVYNGNWSVVSAWSSNNVFVWTPATANPSYAVKVDVRGSWNTGGAERSATSYYTIRPVVTGVTLTPQYPSPQPAGSTIRWTATVQGGWGPYQFKWAVFDGTAWIAMGSWTTNSYFDWTPTIPRTNYKVLVQVRGTWNTGAAEFSVAQPYGIQ